MNPEKAHADRLSNALNNVRSDLEDGNYADDRDATDAAIAAKEMYGGQTAIYLWVADEIRGLQPPTEEEIKEQEEVDNCCNESE